MMRFSITRPVALMLLALVVLLAAGRIVATYPFISRTTDEVVHIAAGMEWLQKHTYFVEELHPPLARITTALPLWLRGVSLSEKSLHAPCQEPFPVFYERIQHTEKPGFFPSRCWKTTDFEILNHGDYRSNLMLARSGTLLWLLLGAAYLYALSLTVADRATAVTAVLIWTMLPVTLAHSGLATTDIAAATAVLIAATHGLRWSRAPSLPHALLLGVGLAVCALVKFSACIFIAALFMPLLLAMFWRAHREHRSLPALLGTSIQQGILALVAMLLVIWAGYRFHVGTLADVFPFAYDAVRDAPQSRWAHLATLPLLPMPEWFMGWLFTLLKNDVGHASYVLGHALDNRGVWYFFPVALWFKTPLALWAMLPITAFLAIRHRVRALWFPFAAALLILGIGMTSNINIGVRHIMPIFPFISLLAAAGLVLLWRSGRIGRFSSAALTAWLVIASLAAHPDYIPFFNATAGDHPEHILLDSDLAWGQDFDKLAQELDARQITAVTTCGVSQKRFDHETPYHIQVTEECPTSPPKGWFAVSRNSRYVLRREKLLWLNNHQPVITIGNGYELFDFNTPSSSTSQP